MLVFTCCANDHHFERFQSIIRHFSQNFDRRIGHTPINRKINAVHGVSHFNFSHPCHSVFKFNTFGQRRCFAIYICGQYRVSFNFIIKRRIKYSGKTFDWPRVTLHTKPHHSKSYTTDGQVFALDMVLWRRQCALRNASSDKYLVYIVIRSTE